MGHKKGSLTYKILNGDGQMACELTIAYRRFAVENSKITSPQSSVEFIKKLIVDEGKDQHVERFNIILLGRSNHILGYHQVSTGGLNATYVDPRQIAQLAIQFQCASIILIHNHPSGTTTPSKEDITLTQRIKEAMKLFEIHVIDHIIYVIKHNENKDFDYISMANEGLL